MSDTENQTEQVGDEQPRYYAELVDEILTQLESFFATHLDELFKEADEYLFKSADEATSTAEQNSLFECMNSVRDNKKRIQQGFVDELGFYLQPMGELDELPEKKQVKKTQELGLIEETEMDEMVMINTMSGKAATDFSESISNLILRFKELGQYNDHIFHGEALEPKRICDAMHESVTNTDLIDENRMFVYRFFNKVVMKDIGSLYDTLNNLLIEQGILPEITFGGSAPHYETHADEGGYDEEALPEEENTQGAPPLPPGARRAFGSGMRGYAGNMSAPASGGAPAPPMTPSGQPLAQGGGAYPQQGYAQAGGQQYPSPPPQGGGGAPGGYASAGPRRAFGSGMAGYSQGGAQGAPQGTLQNGQSAAPAANTQNLGPSGQPYSAGVPVAQVRESIDQFVGGSVDAGVPVTGNGQYYSQQQVMTALTELQAPVDELIHTPLSFDANQIKKALLSSIGESEGGVVDKAVHHVSEKTIDFIKLIFDAIIDEDSITDEIKTLLLSLQIPVIKAAMLDADFFVDDQHPARQLLDKIAEAGVGVTEHTDPVYIEIEKVVRSLLSDYDEDVIAFTKALDDLNVLTEEIYRKARDREDESQKTIKMAHAKSIVLLEIRKITIGKELPAGIRTLVLKIWPSMMFNHFLKNGKANDEWVELLMILQKIIENVQPVNSKEELEELGLTNQDIINATRSKLAKCKKGQDIIDEVMTDLEATFDSLLSTPDLPETLSEEQIQEQKEEAAEVEAELANEVDIEAESKAKIAMLPEGVGPGAWFIVYNGEDKPVRRLKLAVILVHDASMVFVDHLGNVVIEKDAGVFADEIEKGLSGIIMQHSVFDHALHSALETIDH